MDEFGARLLAGGDAVDNALRWAHTSELLDPTPFLSGGELLLTNGLQLSDAATQRAYVERLAGQQLAGLGIGTGVNLAEVPPAMCEAAEGAALPLYEIPYDMPFIAITEKAFRAIADEQNEILRRSMSVHERLEQLVLSEAGLDAVAQSLSQLVGGTILVFNGRVEPLVRADYVHPLAEDDVSAVANELQERRAAGQRHSYIPRHTEFEGRSLALPVTFPRRSDDAGTGPEAWVVATKEAGTLTEFDRLVLRQGTTVVALELLTRRVARDAEWRLASSLLAEIARGAVEGEELTGRLRQFGVGDRLGALVLERPGGPRATPAAETALRHALRVAHVVSLVATHRGAVTALVAAPAGDEELVELAREVQAGASSYVGQALRVGVSRVVAPTQARKAFHEARCALDAVRLGRESPDPSFVPVATHEQLGSFRFLLALQDGEELRHFCSSVLGPIDASDNTYGDELVRSLEAFLEEGSHWERAAKRLFCHRHTLRYRMRKVEELTGRTLASANDRMEFWLALRGRRLFA